MAKKKPKRPSADPNVAAFEAVARLTGRKPETELKPEGKSARSAKVKRQSRIKGTGDSV